MKPRWTVSCFEYITNRCLLFFVIGVGRQLVIIRSSSEFDVSLFIYYILNNYIFQRLVDGFRSSISFYPIFLWLEWFIQFVE